jgi:aryl-alcohol dehydrogenase-like predicted oxidoreductase
MHKYALGTVQFGLDYGVSNSVGQVNFHKCRDILNYGKANGIDTLDTAINYGDSEFVLGRLGVTDFNLVTKLPRIPPGLHDIEEWVYSEIEASLKRLGVLNLHAILLHNPDDLLSASGSKLVRALAKLKSEWYCRKLGISIYDILKVEQFHSILQLDIIQAPLNIVDNRLITTGLLSRLKDLGSEIHVRSVFLQGLLIMPKHFRPNFCQKWPNFFQRWDDWLDEIGCTPLEACLSFINSIDGVDRVVIGVTSEEELKQIFLAKDVELQLPAPFPILSEIDILNPSTWSQA